MVTDLQISVFFFCLFFFLTKKGQRDGSQEWVSFWSKGMGVEKWKCPYSPHVLFKQSNEEKYLPPKGFFHMSVVLLTVAVR